MIAETKLVREWFCPQSLALKGDNMDFECLAVHSLGFSPVQKVGAFEDRVLSCKQSISRVKPQLATNPSPQISSQFAVVECTAHSY